MVATTLDPVTPYEGGVRLVRQLGNARLLTMEGAVHVAYPGQAHCVDRYVETYFTLLALPPRGKRCRQDVTFAAPSA